MSDFIEDFYYGNIELQELTTEITSRLRKKLSELVKKRKNWLQSCQIMKKHYFQTIGTLTMNF